MRRTLLKLRKKLPLFLTFVMLFGLLPLPQATALEEETSVMKTPVTEEVYQVQQQRSQPKSSSLAWNQLTKLDRGILPSIYVSEEPISRMSSSGRYVGVIRMNVSMGEPMEVREVVSVFDRLTGEIDNVMGPSSMSSFNRIRNFDMSDDARFIAFSHIEDLYPQVTKVYVFDRVTRELETITQTGGRSDSGNGNDRVEISGEGRYIVFDSLAKGLVEEDQDEKRDVFLYDRETKTTTRISTRPGLTEEDLGHSSSPSMSMDGRYIAFDSEVNLLNSAEYNYMTNVYLYDRDTGTIRRISDGLGGEVPDGWSYEPSISADGQTVAFLSDASNLVEGDENYEADLFIYNNQRGIQRIAFVPDGNDHGMFIKSPSISPDGKYVGYELLQYGDEDEIKEAYVADIEAQASVRVTVPQSPLGLINPSRLPTVGMDGNPVVFFSMYNESLNGNDFELPGMFVASMGSAPTWPTGSELQVEGGENNTVVLGWPDAADSSEVLGYQVYKDGTVIGFVPYGQGNQFNSDVQPGMQHTFHIEAVNSNFHVSAKLEKGAGSDPGNPSDRFDISWEADNSRNGLPSPGSEIEIMAYTGKGLDGQAVIEYKVWKDENHTDSKATKLLLEEVTHLPGAYRTKFVLEEGTAELTSLTIKMKDPATGKETEKKAANLPVQISGRVNVNFDNPGDAPLTGAVLSYIHPRFGSHFMMLTGQGAVTLDGLVPGEEYRIVLRSSNNRHILAEADGVKAEAGRTNNVSLTIEQPAKIRFQVLDPKGHPRSGIQIQLYDENQEYLGRYTSGEEGWTYWQEGLVAGSKITAKVDVSGEWVQKVPDQSIELTPGVNETVIQLQALPEGILKGKVVNPAGEPVMNALVKATQTFNGNTIVKEARSNLDGEYQFNSMLTGEVAVEAYETSYSYRTEESLKAHITVGNTTTLTIPVRQPGYGVVNLKVFVKYLDTDWMGPVNMEQMNYMVEIEADRGGWMRGYFQNAYQFSGYPGDTVNVCVTGSTPSFMTVCNKATLDENANGTVEIRYEEKGGRVQAKLAQMDHRWVSGSLYSIQGNSKSWYRSVGDWDMNGDMLNLNIMDPGNYRLELTRRLNSSETRYEYANVEFTVHDQQIVNVGTIQFSPTSYFVNQWGNRFTAWPNRAVPGSVVTFRVFYQNGKNREAKDTYLFLDVPQGMSPVIDTNGNIIVTGAEGAVLEEGKLKVPLGDLTSNQSGGITYQLKVDSAFNRNTVAVAAQIRSNIEGKSIEETMGTIQLDTPRLTLELPEEISQLDTQISGYAPAGSTVKVYDGQALVGSAVASPIGYWSMNATLPDIGNPSVHVLHAETEANSVTLQSEKVYVDYDDSRPRLIEMAMAQAPNQKWVTFGLENGISRLPYSVVPGNPFQFELKFDRPDDVENVYVYLGGQMGEPVKAVRSGDLYRAVAPTGQDALGGIYVSYDVVPGPYTYEADQPSLEQIRQSMPRGMRDFEVVSTTPFELKDGKYTGTAVLHLPQLDDMKMTVTFTLQPHAGYQPSDGEIALAQKSGDPVLGSSFDAVETEEGLTSITKGYVPMDLIFQNGAPGAPDAFTALSRIERWIGKAEQYKDLAEYSTHVHMEFNERYKTVKDIKGQFDSYKSYAGKINRITYNVERGLDCLAELPTTVKQAGKALGAVVIGEVAKVGLGAWTGAMGLVGPAGAAAGFAAQVASSKIDKYVDAQIDSIGTGYNQCNDEDEKKRKRKKIADPKWIYDPSGYVYEAVPENRLEDVLATVLYLDGGQWTVWDAGPYEQVNPHYTDREGRYGWDVPPGKWKVVWEKEGYEVQTSAELDVPPPHTEVHAGLISRAAPQVETVTGYTYEGGSFVDIVFTKYLKVSELPNRTMEIKDSEGSALGGTIQFVEASEDPVQEGEKLSRTLRFQPNQELRLNEQYDIKIHPHPFKSYADVWMTDSYTGSFSVKELDTVGPRPVSASGDEGGRMIRLTFNEALGRTIDRGRFEVNGAEGAVVSAVTDVKDSKVLYLTLTQPISSDAQVLIREGAATDLTGNASGEESITVSIQSAVSNNAWLGGLAITPGVLSPNFSSEQMNYTLRLPVSVGDIDVTASLSHAQAKLVIEGDLAASGTTKRVRIPHTGEITLVSTAPDGVTKRIYTIQVERVDETQDDATLSSITVNPGTLNPIFQPTVLEYGVIVDQSVTELTITAVGNDPHSKLKMNGVAVNSGNAMPVIIPSDGRIQLEVTAPDGVTRNTYLIQVSRKSGSSGGSGGGSTPISVGDSLDVGKDAQIEKRKAANGGVSLHVTLNRETVKKALERRGKEEKPLFVETTEQADEYVLNFESEVLNELKKASAVVIWKTGLANLTIPMASVESKLSKGVYLIIGKPTVQEGKTYLEAAKQQSTSLKLEQGPILAGVFEQTGEAISPVMFEMEFLSREVKQEAVYHYQLNKSLWTFLKNGTTVSIDSPSILAVMTYNHSFTDLIGHWAKEDIEWMAQRLLVSGYSVSEFKPQQAVSRAEFTTMLVRALGLTSNLSDGTVRFTDVSNEDWFYTTVRTGVEAGIVTGMPDGTFKPNETITREQMTIMIWKAYLMKMKERSAAAPKADLNRLNRYQDREQVAKWSANEIALSLQEGLVKGVTDRRFDPKGMATRAQAVVVIKNLVKD
ncbi:S-layer homology domain-containing protein [Ammoniphilus sp. CFH 90114]|uniref:S-layer homology domain-containing protein n=1 Tax=Ammoniphilus sp. CFH 90114 TaxID=2493665 RepID=UPI0013E99C1B|nr:S-layer homology domain-containing protein [Ammoniphilus sp. CFH 90114]